MDGITLFLMKKHETFIPHLVRDLLTDTYQLSAAKRL